MTVATKIMEHWFDKQRDVRFGFMTGIARIVTRLVNIVVVAKRTFFARVIEMLKRNRQQGRSANHRVSRTVPDTSESENKNNDAHSHSKARQVGACRSARESGFGTAKINTHDNSKITTSVTMRLLNLRSVGNCRGHTPSLLVAL